LINAPLMFSILRATAAWLLMLLQPFMQDMFRQQEKELKLRLLFCKNEYRVEFQ